MKRTRAQALALVNWNGVFYERYLLDRHVTALEGANGSGKTTVMIAAYVVLLPDMSRLRFTNVGESGATGGDKGIWGRLGEAGRPSYSVLDFEIADRGRLVAGVHLERKGEPSVEPTPFIVWGLGGDVRLQELLLVPQGENEVVPELTELRESAARLGGRLQTFTSARDYFAALFDQGVIPLRLGTDEERNKLNEMLRTSMTGGISRALTSELRAFLLKEESGLADTLQRMKANLDACRRTRTEVQESRRLEREIGNIVEAGHTMFAAAFMATRERAEEFGRRVAESEAARAAAWDAQTAAAAALARIVLHFEGLEGRRRELQRALESAKAWHGRIAGALAAARELSRRTADHDAAVRTASASAETRDECDRVRGVHREMLRRAQEDYRRAALGLADLQQGIEELHRRAGAYHQVLRRLREAEKALELQIHETEGVDHALIRAKADLDAADRERRQASTRLADAREHRERYGEALDALRTLTGTDVFAEDVVKTSAAALRRFRDQAALSERVLPLHADLVDARRLAAQQAAARARARELGITLGSERAAVTIRALLDRLDADRGDHEMRAQSAAAGAAGAERQIKALEAARQDLLLREPEWQECQACAVRLQDAAGFVVADRAGLDAARISLGGKLSLARREEEAAAEAQEALVREARELLAAGGPFAQDLLRLKDELGADLLASAFEDVGVKDAAVLEARLGALAQALVVDDPSSAARAIANRSDSVPDVLLVSRDTDLHAMHGTSGRNEKGSRDLVIDEGLALRVSRIPERPRLGRKAREARVEELRRAAEEQADRIEHRRSARRQLERSLQDADRLLAGYKEWAAGDPQPELVEARRKIADAARQMEVFRTAAAQHAESARLLRPRIDALRDLLSDSLLLDPPDHEERARHLEQQHELALAAQVEVARTAASAELVEASFSALKTPPLSPDELESLREQADRLLRRRESLDTAVDALEYVALNREALGWSEAPARLAKEHALVPALEAQLREAAAVQDQAQAASQDADRGYDDATARWQDADGARRVARQAYEAAAEGFEFFGIPAPSEPGAAEAANEVTRLEGELEESGTRRDALLTEQGVRQKEVDQAQQRAREADDKLSSDKREAEPAIARWERLRERALKYQLFGSSLATEHTALADVRGHVNFVQAAQTQRSLLIERLQGSQGASALLAELEVLRHTSDADFGEGVLNLWLTVRDWLRRRLPAEVAEVDDPREGLLRLRERLSSLEDRLTRQESDLRGASEDVARGIDVQIRKARGQVQRLNRNLEGVSFGGIRGIRVRLIPVERMEQVLRALREGAAQGILFQPDLPIEEALDEIFRRFGGGRSGGQRLLDYREYVTLQVEIRRKTGTDWEIANPTRLSTGEAIGIGAALMMVILTEWERDSTLLRGKKSYGSLRFLFLDEANRLSHDNLGVLFDLCQTLDLQLLIAAPEVARAEGNTTYRLVRRTGPDGREEVLVSGRRARNGG